MFIRFRRYGVTSWTWPCHSCTLYNTAMFKWSSCTSIVIIFSLTTGRVFQQYLFEVWFSFMIWYAQIIPLQSLCGQLEYIGQVKFRPYNARVMFSLVFISLAKILPLFSPSVSLHCDHQATNQSFHDCRFSVAIILWVMFSLLFITSLKLAVLLFFHYRYRYTKGVFRFSMFIWLIFTFCQRLQLINYIYSQNLTCHTKTQNFRISIKEIYT